MQGAQAHRGPYGLHVAGRGDHDDVCAHAQFPHLMHEFEACPVGQIVVEQDQVDGLPARRVQGLGGAVRTGGHPEAGNLPHEFGVDFGDTEVVVHDQDVNHRASPPEPGER